MQQRDPVDWQAVLAVFDGDDAFAREVATLFISSGQSSLDEIAKALARGDLQRLGEKAHEVKGASASLHADAAERDDDRPDHHGAERQRLGCRRLLQFLAKDIELHRAPARAAVFLRQIGRAHV